MFITKASTNNIKFLVESSCYFTFTVVFFFNLIKGINSMKYPELTLKFIKNMIITNLMFLLSIVISIIINKYYLCIYQISILSILIIILICNIIIYIILHFDRDIFTNSTQLLLLSINTVVILFTINILFLFHYFIGNLLDNLLSILILFIIYVIVAIFLIFIYSKTIFKMFKIE